MKVVAKKYHWKHLSIFWMDRDINTRPYASTKPILPKYGKIYVFMRMEMCLYLL